MRRPSAPRRADRHARAAASAAFAEFGRCLRTSWRRGAATRRRSGASSTRSPRRYFLGAEVDLDETYAWGWDELKRLTDEMAATADRIVPGRQRRRRGGRTRRRPARRIEQPRGVPRLDAGARRPHHRRPGRRPLRHPRADPPDRVLLAPTNDGGIYYTGPSEDFTRPGRMWWSVPDGIDGVHHLARGHDRLPRGRARAITCRSRRRRYRADLLNRWQRLLCWCSGHGEGWALYAERLMDELGYLDDPGDQLGMLDGQALRAARVIVDIGMHLELEIPRDNPFGFHPGERWTPELGWSSCGMHCRMDDAVLDFEVKRYLGWPGQAPSYKVGERIWLEARADAQARQGADFDLKAFHRAALDLGSLGLDPLRTALAKL